MWILVQGCTFSSDVMYIVEFRSVAPQQDESVPCVSSLAMLPQRVTGTLVSHVDLMVECDLETRYHFISCFCFLFLSTVTIETQSQITPLSPCSLWWTCDRLVKPPHFKIIKWCYPICNKGMHEIILFSWNGSEWIRIVQYFNVHLCNTWPLYQLSQSSEESQPGPPFPLLTDALALHTMWV